MPPISPIIFTFPHILFLPAELLSACHELRCRYGCVMTRNGTFCFCADGFEVGEDGTSCRGKIQRRWRGAPPVTEQPPSSPSPSARLPSKVKKKKKSRRRFSVWEPSVCRRGILYSALHLEHRCAHTPTRHTQNAITPYLFCCLYICRSWVFWQLGGRQRFAVKSVSGVLVSIWSQCIP